MIELICLYDANIRKQPGSIPLVIGKHSPGKRGVPALHLRGIFLENQTEGQGGTGRVDMKKGAVPKGLSYSSVCFAATSPILGEVLEYQRF